MQRFVALVMVPAKHTSSAKAVFTQERTDWPHKTTTLVSFLCPGTSVGLDAYLSLVNVSTVELYITGTTH